MPKDSKRKERRTEKESKLRQAASIQRVTWILLSLGSVLAIQIWMTAGRLSLPFLDTRLHYNYDNADYSFRARNGNRNGDLRSQLGVTVNTYSRWGERTGRPSYYTDHPFLMKALFQQFTKMVGTQEWASRVFYLGVSFAIVSGLYLIILKTTTGNLLAAFAAAATLVSLPLFAVYQTSVKFEADGMLASIWLFVALLFYLERGTRGSLGAYAALALAAMLTHWTAILFEAAISTYLLILAWRKRDQRARQALLVTVGAAVVGGALLIASMSFLHRGLAGARIALVSSFARRSASISAGEWRARQWTYLKANFTDIFPWIALGLVLVVAGQWFWSRRAKPTQAGGGASPAEVLLPFFLATLTVGTIWILAFPQGSFIHIYWQYWLSVPIAVLVAASLAPLRSRFEVAVGALATGLLVVYMLNSAKAAYAGVLNDQLGTAADIGFLQSLRDDEFDRFVFVPISNVPLNQWFQGPLFEYYTDRPVSIASSPDEIRASDKVLVLRYAQRDQVLAALSGWARKPLGNEKCGERICAYDVLVR